MADVIARLDDSAPTRELTDRQALDLVDLAEAALARVSTPQEAEDVWRKVATLDEAVRRFRLSTAVAVAMSRTKLRAERRWGELLGPARTGRPEGNVSPGHVSNDERQERKKARQLARVPEPVFNAYVDSETTASEYDSLAKIVSQVRAHDEVFTRADIFRVDKTYTRETDRAERDANLPEPVALEAGPFGVIYADPPWRYDDAKPNRAIENQYPTMATLDICALTEREDFPAIQDDAVLFLWATAPKLREALAVMDAWGFEYRTNAVWVKAQLGMGYWFRNRHELLLVGRRGRFSPPTEDRRPGSVFDAPRAGHSVKPENVRQAIESMFPDVARVELFARERTEGWAVWGNQA